MTALTVAPSSGGIKQSFVVIRRTELSDAVSSVLQFKLLVQPSGLSRKHLEIIKAVDHLKRCNLITLCTVCGNQLFSLQYLLDTVKAC